MTTTWAAKVLADVPTVCTYDNHTPPRETIWRDDALAAIYKMVAGDGLVERAEAMVDRTECYQIEAGGQFFNVGEVMRDLLAHIAALTAQNREMALDVLASSGQAAEAYAAQLAAEAERDALRAKVAENRISEPHDPGDFVGDIFYGHPIKTTMGTHRWTGTEWVALPSEAQALAGLLAEARKEAAALRERVARLEGAMRWIIENNDEGNGLYSRDGLYAKRARAALTDGGTEYERKVAQMKKDFPNGI